MFSVFRNFRNRETSRKSILFIIGALLLFPIIISAQSFSAVTGIVSDSSGAVIPGVKVTLLDTKTSREVTTTTNDQGVYSFNNIAPGIGYKLTFAGQGFQTYVLNDVQLGVGKTETQNAQLTTGQVSEIVQVTSTTGDATLNTTDASIGNVIGSRQLRELPIQLRGSPAALIGLQPGAVGNNVGAGGGNRTGSVTGSRADQGNITVDGIDANDVTTGQAFATVANAPIDSIQEFRAVTSGPNASEGRSSGGQIQLSTKPGSNDFHGSLREYYRTDKTAANDFFNNRTVSAAQPKGVPRPKLKRHQFGGSIGGPLPFFNFGEGGPMFNSGKDKSFFFFDFEGRRDDSEVTTTRTVPLQHFRNGQLGYIRATDAVTGAACGASSRLDTTPNCIGILTSTQVAALDPRGIGFNTALLNFNNARYPLPNDLTGGNGINTGLYRFNAPNVRADNIYTTRIDVNPTQNQRIFGRFTITRRDSTNALQQFPGDEDAVSFKDKSYSIAGGHTWVITPSITNVATVGLSKSVNIFTPPTIPSFPNSFGAGGVLTAPFPSLSYQDRNVFVPTIRDDVTWNAGNHSFQFGGSFKPIRQNPSLINDFNFVTLGIGGGTSQLNSTLRPGVAGVGSGIANITGALTNYDAAFAYALGRYAQISTNFVYNPAGAASAPGSGRKRSYAYNEYEFYVQDNWRVRNDLTLNLGVRYHYYPPPYEVNGFQGSQNVDFQEMLNARAQNAANGTAGNTSEPLLSFDLSGKANDRPDLYKSDRNNIAPRLGFAYNPTFENKFLSRLFGNKKTVIRGNASIVYDRVGGAITFIQDQSNFVFDSSSATAFGTADATASLLTDPRFISINALPIQNVAPSVARPSTPNVNSAGVPIGSRTSQSSFLVAKNFEIPYSYSFNFGMQREMKGNIIVDVSYVGRLGRKLFTQADSAQALNFRDPASGQLMFDAFNAIQAQLRAGVPVTPQPWVENQNGLARATTPTYCATRAQGSCTGQLVAVFGTLLAQGGTGDLVQQMYLNNLLRPNVGMSSQFATNRFITNQGTSSYHGALVSVQKRFSKGFEFDFNYTFSHSVDNQSSIVNTVSGGLLCDAINVNACRGDSDFDIRHLANANGIWDIPIGRGRWIGGNVNKWVDFFVGGWTLSGILGVRSGLAINSASGVFPVSFIVNSPAIQIGNESAFKANIRDEVGGIQYFADATAAQAALRYPRHGEIGSRNIFRTSSFWNLDMGLSKKFKAPWSESHKFSVRVDAFNATNTNSFNAPNLSYNTTTFGRITSSLSTPRELQFALRYDF